MSRSAPDWFDAMRRGDFAAAWRISDSIIASRTPGEQCQDLPRHQQWIWTGEPLRERRVLVRCYHGLGDTIQFARFLPMLDDITRETIVWAQPPLLGLLATLPGERLLLPLHDGAPQVDYDVDIEIMELAHALRVTVDCVANGVPYFQVVAKSRVSQQFSVGVVARAGAWDARRSVAPDLLERAIGVEGVRAFNLQLEPPLQDLTDLSTSDPLALASRLRSLDLVITTDTMLAHLAGALAVPVWTLLPADADWRWMEPHRSDSPWYPTMRLFRQRTPGDWGPALQAVHDALESRASSGAR